MGADVPVDDSQVTAGQIFFPVGVIQPCTHLCGHQQAVPDRDRQIKRFRPVKNRPKILAHDVLHGDEVGVLHVTQVEYLDDVLMG